MDRMSLRTPALLVAALLAGACQQASEDARPVAVRDAPAGVPSDPDARESVSETRASGVASARVRGADAGDAAAFQGRIAIEAGCVFLRSKAETLLLVAASQSIALGSDGRTLSDGGRQFRSGDSVTVGGSSSLTEALDSHWVQRPPSGCRTAKSWLAISIVPQR